MTTTRPKLYYSHRWFARRGILLLGLLALTAALSATYWKVITDVLEEVPSEPAFTSITDETLLQHRATLEGIGLRLRDLDLAMEAFETDIGFDASVVPDPFIEE